MYKSKRSPHDIQVLGALGYHVGDKIDVQFTNDTIIINKMKTK